MWIKKLFIKIKNYFYRMFNPVIFNLNDEYSDILEKSTEIARRNVLIGTIRRREQLSANLSNRFYHIPMSELISGDDIEYVAIYQSKNLFRENTDVNGIVYYGRVTNAAIVKRHDIPEIPSKSNELYMRFDVDRWQKIDHHIQIREISPQVSLKTSFYQFSNARFINELFFKTANEYIFFLGIVDLINEIYDGFTLNSLFAIRRGNRIIVKSEKRKQVFSVKELSEKPYGKITDFFENH